MRMRNVTILKFHDGRQFKWILCLKIVLFEESRSVLPFQINLAIICQSETVKNFEEPDNCDPVLLCTSTDMETIWPGVWCLFINISGHGQCGRKRKKHIQILCYRKRIFKQIVNWDVFLSNQLASQKLSFGQH